MAILTPGVVGLKFGTVALTGYLVQGTTKTASTENVWLLDETGNKVGQVTNFGELNELSLEVIPLTGVTVPTTGTVLTYDSLKYVITGITKTGTNTDNEKWSITGTSSPDITYT
jgi:hypothetical protein